MSRENRPLPMAEQVRRAGPFAVSLLVGIHIRAGAETMAAIEALSRDAADGGPDPEEAMWRLGRILRLLSTGKI